MDNQDNIQTSKNEDQSQTVSEQIQSCDISNTAIPEYLDIVRNEYEIERDKKQSFENRAGLIMALLGAICIFLFEKVQLKEIFSFMTQSLTFYDLIKILSGLTVYVSFSFTMIMIIKTITIKKHDNFEVKNIDEELIAEPRVDAICKIMFTYRDIIIQHRILNEKRAEAFRKSLYGMSVILISIIIYVSLV